MGLQFGSNRDRFIKNNPAYCCGVKFSMEDDFCKKCGNKITEEMKQKAKVQEREFREAHEKTRADFAKHLKELEDKSPYGFRPRTEETSDTDCPVCEDGTKVIVVKDSKCNVPPELQTFGPAGFRQWRKTTEYHCNKCGTEFPELPEKKK